MGLREIGRWSFVAIIADVVRGDSCSDGGRHIRGSSGSDICGAASRIEIPAGKDDNRCVLIL